MLPAPHSGTVDSKPAPDNAANARRRRVARVASEIARSLDLERAGAAERRVAPAPMGSRGLARLAAEVCSGERSSAAHLRPAIGHGPPRPSRSADMMDEVVRLCELFDEQMEALPFEWKPLDAIHDELAAVARFEGVRPELVDTLRGLRYRELESGAGLARRLPVHARLAGRVFQQLGPDRDYELGELEELALQDPVLAGSVMQVANSALYSPEQRIGELSHAISYVGTSATRQVLLAAVMRPLFASAGLSRAWTHAVQMAQLCAALARQTRLLEPGPALLLGLVHDVGSLAVHFLPPMVVERYRRLTENGDCPPAYVEHLLLGCDHGEIGAGVLIDWCFPEHLIEVVRLHHQPERSESTATSLLYLAEFWAGLDEDLPSHLRVEECSRRTGISLESLANVRNRQDALTLLRTVA